MNATDNTAVENKNFFSSLFNSIQQPEKRFATGLTILLSAIFGIIIHYGWQQPYDKFVAIFSIVFCLIIALCIVGTNYLRDHNTTETLVFIPAFALALISTWALAFITSDKEKQFYIVISIFGGFIASIIFGIFANELWRRKREYYLPFLLVLAIVSALLIFSNQLTETKVGDIDLEMYSKRDGKLAKKKVFIPLFYSTLEDEYFAVVKLAPRKIWAKVTIPDNPKAKWRGERKFEDSIYVDFQPLNYAARQKIMGSGIWQIETKTTSEVDMHSAIKVEILKQLNLEPSDVNIKISDI